MFRYDLKCYHSFIYYEFNYSIVEIMNHNQWNNEIIEKHICFKIELQSTIELSKSRII